ncbi:MAG TPA: hypothetical protein VLM79_06620, partial [Kofleriaceae bacterium]|nr:hypothetical protein [Kofleriaceae bacterium]
PVQVVAFDQVTTPIYDGRADKIGNIEAALVSRGALGASDVGQALAWLAAHAPKSRIVVVTDGVITAGAKVDGLPALAKQLASRGVDRIDVALSGGIRDEQAAAAVARSGLAHTGAVLDLDRGVGEVARRIGLAVRTELPIVAEGARWVFPHMIAAAQPGDEVTVYVRRAAPAQQVALSVAGVRTVVSTAAVTPALLGRAFAGAEIAELDAQLDKASGDAAAKLRADIVRRSVAARVVSSQTSMLVLESDGDYARYGIDRAALAEILTVGATGVELAHRVLPRAQIAAPADVVETKPMNKKQSFVVKDADKAGKSDFSDAKRKSVPEAEILADEIGGDAEGGQRGAREELRAVRQPAEEKEPATERSRRAPPRAAASTASAGSAAGGGALDERRLGSLVGRANGQNSPPADAAPAARPEPPRPAPSSPRVEVPLPPPPPMRVRNAIASDSERDADGEMDDNDDGLSVNRRKPSLRGPLAEIERALAAGKVDGALAQAAAWHKKEPGDVLALIGLGDALEAKKDLETAGRVYGSIIDLYPARADFRRFAGERLERVGKAQRALIIDTYRRAVEQRPDHLTGHRMLAYALVRDGQYAAAFAAILAGIDQQYPANRFAGAERVLAEDVGMIGAAYVAHAEGKRDEVLGQLARRGIPLATRPSTRFIMYWETDANDVDFHIRDARGGHAWYSHKQLPSGGELYADITTGYGPECFAIQGTPKAGPYRLSINYYSQGPMGYGMGLLQIQKFDGQGNLSFEDRPYVIMTDQAFVDLGTYR